MEHTTDEHMERLRSLHEACAAAVTSARTSVDDIPDYRQLARDCALLLEELLASGQKSKSTAPLEAEDAASTLGMLGMQDLKRAQVIIGAATSWGVAPSLPYDLHSVGAGPPGGNPVHLWIYVKILCGFIIEDDQSGITTIIIHRHLSLLYASLFFLTLPKVRVLRGVDGDGAAEMLERLFTSAPLPDSFAAFAHVSQDASLPPWIRRTCGTWMSRVLLTPGGVSAFLTVSLSDGEEPEGERITQMANILLAPPRQATSPESYYESLFQQLLVPLRKTNSPWPLVSLTATILKDVCSSRTAKPEALKILTSTLFSFLPPASSVDAPIPTFPSLNRLSGNHGLRTLRVFLTAGGPVDTSYLDTQVLPRLPFLWSLWACAVHGKVDQAEQDGIVILGFLLEHCSTGKTVKALMEIMTENETRAKTPFVWKCSITKALTYEPRAEEENTPKIIPTEVNPSQVDMELIVRVLKEPAGVKLSGELFISILSEYLAAQAVREEHPERMLSLLHAIFTMISTLGPSILSHPDQILTFVYNVLETAVSSRREVRVAEERSKERANITKGKEPTSDTSLLFPEDQTISSATATRDKLLRIVDPPSKITQLDGKDAEDEDEDEDTEGDHEILTLALTLLNSLLDQQEEWQKEVGEKAFRLLPIIAESLGALVDELREEGGELKELSISLRIALLTQLANAGPETRTKRVDEFANAMNALQEESIPDRAYGLGTLRSLILARDEHLSSSEERQKLLVILTAFVQEEDSFVYLQAVKALSAMTDVYGNEAIDALAHVYADRGKDLDTRLRVGEAMLQTIDRAGTTLANYVKSLVTPILRVLGSNEEGTIKASAFGILAMAADTYPLALGPYHQELEQVAEKCLLVEREPEIRRAATLFLVQLIRGLEVEGVEWSTATLKEAWKCLRRVAESAEEDELVKGHAQVGLDMVDEVLKSSLDASSQSFVSPLIMEIMDE